MNYPLHNLEGELRALSVYALHLKPRIHERQQIVYYIKPQPGSLNPVIL